MVVRRKAAAAGRAAERWGVLAASGVVIFSTAWTFAQYAAKARLARPDWAWVVALELPRELVWAWVLAFLPSLALGVTLYAWVRREAPEPARFGTALRRVELVGALTFAISAWVVLTRAGLALFLYGEPGLFAPGELSRWLYGEVAETPPRLAWALAAIGHGVLLLSLLHAARVVRRKGASAGGVFGFAAVHLVLAVALFAFAARPWAWARMPEAVRHWRAVSHDPPFTFTGPDGARWLNTYFRTHDGTGAPLTLAEVGAAHAASVPCPPVCRLPFTILATLRGIPLNLSQEAPREREPTEILEVSHPPGTVILHRPHELSGRVLPLKALDTVEIRGDSLVLKIDAEVPVAVFVQLAETLRDRGVRRLTLAAWPADTFDIPAPPLRLVPEARPDRERLRFEGRRRAGLYVVPPPLLPGGRCSRKLLPALYAEAMAWEVPEPGTLPDEVALPAEGTFGRFVSRLDRAVVGGARVVYLAPSGPAGSAGDPASRSPGRSTESWNAIPYSASSSRTGS